MVSLLVPIVAAMLAATPAVATPAVATPHCYTVTKHHHSSTRHRCTVSTATPSSATPSPAAPSPVSSLPTTAPAPPISTPPASTPAALPFYVDPDGAAAQQERAYQAAGDTADAQRISAIADQPQPLWIVGPTSGVTDQVHTYVEHAQAAGARPSFVGYDIPDRDCGGYSGGGASGEADYQAWAGAFADGLRGSNALVVLEPDAIPHQLSGCAGAGDERYALLADATAKLSAAGAQVYLDAGNPEFTGNVDATADALRRSGVAQAAGFSLNVSNFDSTQDNIAYGTAISQKLGGTHFVIDTSRNGASSKPQATGGAPSWCNPPDRLLGTPPTTQTGNALVDALLWIKRPGESDGSCHAGDPQAGGWFPAYALRLVPTGG